ncbi:serine hydrolase domain-containing protein [Steroidobacter sp.]|uniref:serine hydrolase domain-containing protein n=1 Tax=Steroidobacter sp. TaxID=1978227 RepID=UPI001A531899|nr:serine hydrolase domain-containing protein [Steroidobacter sp.]MBL8271327.1 beta-lactamase family protein [Steroidobacter sp.]
MKIRTTLLAVWLLGLSVSAAAETRFSAVQQLIDAEFRKDSRGGVSVGVVENGELVWTYCVGQMDEAKGRPASVDTVYPIGSTTKIFTGLMLLQLVERGQVHLSDPVERYVPEVRQMKNKYPWAPPITLIQLATMTAGVQRGANMPPGVGKAVAAAKTFEDMAALAIPGFEYLYEPGTASRYSNAGYSILGLALSRAAKRPFGEYIRSEILEPLGMHHSAFVAPPQLQEQFALGYRLDRPQVAGNVPYNSAKNLLMPASDLKSTVLDMARLMRFQMLGGNESVLKQTTLLDSYQLLVPTDALMRYGDGVGFAAVRNEDSKLVALGHGGSDADGFISSYEFDGATKTGIVVLANTYKGTANYKRLTRTILAVMNPDSAGGSGLKDFEEH